MTDRVVVATKPCIDPRSRMSAYLPSPSVLSPRPVWRPLSTSRESEMHGRLAFNHQRPSIRTRARFQHRCSRIRCDVSGAGAMTPESDPESLNVQQATETHRIGPMWRFLAETAIQLTIAGFAVAASVVAKTRFYAFASAFLCIPQVVLSVRRFIRETDTQPSIEMQPDAKLKQEHELETPEAIEVKQDEETQALVTSAAIRGAIVAEVDALRYSIEQMETSTIQREHARNRSIAEALASLDESIRAVRRTVETRNQIESSAPFAIVAELENTQSRLKDAEREKVELQVKLQMAQSNFEEAKRQGKRARREADEAAQRELLLRTELATVSTRLARLDEVTERLDTAERRNDELREEFVSGSRELETLRQSAADADNRVERVENISQILRQKLQTITGIGGDSDKGAKRRDQISGLEAEAEQQFWQRRLRDRASIPGPGSLLYQELLGGSKDGDSSKEWPEAPLEGGAKEKKRRAQLENLPADGGFGTVTVSDVPEEQGSDQAGSREQLPSSTGDTIFSFSRGEFNGSKASISKTLPAAPRETKEADRDSATDPVTGDSGVDMGPEEGRNGTSESDMEVLPSTQKAAVNASRDERAHSMEKTAEAEVEMQTGEIDASKPQEDTSEGREVGVVDDVSSEGDLERAAPGAGEGAPRDARNIEETHFDVPLAGMTDGAEPIIPAGEEEERSLDVPREANTSEPSDKGLNGTIVGLSEDATAFHDDTGTSIQSERMRATDVEEQREQEDPAEHETLVDPSRVAERDSAPPVVIPDIGGAGSATQVEAQNEETRVMEDVSSPVEGKAETFSTSNGDSTSQPKQKEASMGETYSSLTDLREERDELSRTRPPSVDSSEDEVSKSNPADERRPFRERVPVPTAEELVDSANELVKKARKRGLAVAQSDILFKRAISSLEAAMSLGLNRAFVQAEFGGALLAWAKVNLADPAANTRLTRALGHLSASLEARPDDGDTIFNTGLCLCLLGSTSEASEAKRYYSRACGLYDRLLGIDGASRIGSFNGGLAYISLGRLGAADDEMDAETTIGYFETAADRFRLALELKPGDNKAQSYLEDCIRELAQLRQE